MALTSGRRAGKCCGTGAWRGSRWEHKSHFAHALHPGPMSSLLSSTVLLCTHRGKMIFCLKHVFFFYYLHFCSRRRSDCFVSLEKRGWGSWGKSGKSLRELCRSQGWAQWLSPHQTLPPLHDAIPNTAPWDELSTRHHRGVKLMCRRRLGAFSPCCSILAAREMQVLQGEERKGMVISGVPRC